MSAGAAPRFRAEGDTNQGEVRGNNEDWFAIVAGPHGDFHLWIVADGMGGGVKGEVASRLAVETLAEFMTTDSWVDPVAALGEGFRLANAAVFARGTGGGEATRSVMGTTLVAVLIQEATGRYWLANCGDSRAYLLDGEVLHQISQDHSLVAERVRAGEMTPAQARVADERNIVTRAIGIESDVRSDVAEMGVLAPGEQLLLCSDGLYGMITDEEIAAIAGSGTVASAIDLLIKSANAAGGRDNITVLIGGQSEAAALPWDATMVERRVAAPVVSEPPTAPPSGRRLPPLVAAALAGAAIGALVAAALLAKQYGSGAGATTSATPTATSLVDATSTAITTSTPPAAPTLTPGNAAEQYAIVNCNDKVLTPTNSNFSAISGACRSRFSFESSRAADFNAALCAVMKSDPTNLGLIREAVTGATTNDCGFIAGGALLTLPDARWFRAWKAGNQ